MNVLPPGRPSTSDRLSLVVLGVALAVLVLGHGLGVGGLTRLIPGGSVMVPSTAAGFAFLSLGLLLRHRAWRGDLLLRALAGATLVLVAVNVGAGRGGIDTVLFGRDVGGEMALATSTGFVLAALTALTLTVPAISGRAAYHALPTVGLILGGIATVGYLIARGPIANVLPFAPVALHTAILFVLTFLALMHAAPHPGWIALLARSERMGNRNARRVLPAILIVPTLIAGILLVFVRRGLDPTFAIAILTVGITTVFGTVLVLNARMLNRHGDHLTQAISALDAALAERNVLLAEVYHRVKNNLQQIEALLATEARKHRTEPEVRASFDAMSSRIRSVGVVHRLLLQQRNLERVPLDAFLTTLADTVTNATGLAARGIAIDVDAPPVETSLSTSTTLGLLVNEIVANAVKHAFPDDRTGRIAITVDDDPDDPDCLRLTVADDGVGFDPANRAPGTGTRIIAALATQLSATLREGSPSGSRTVISIPVSVLEEQR